MKAVKAIALIILTCLLSGCVLYLDNPVSETISGHVIDARSGVPVEGANIAVWSGRKMIPFPGLEFITSGHGTTDQDGYFEFIVKDHFPIEIQISKGGEIGQARIEFSDRREIKIMFPNSFRLFE